MLVVPLLFVFFAIFAFILAFMPSNRPTLKLDMGGGMAGQDLPMPGIAKTKKQGPLHAVLGVARKVAFFNKPLVFSDLGKRVSRDLGMARTPVSTEEFFLIKEILIVFFLWVSVSTAAKQDYFLF